ncbi:MAG: tetrahydrofolate dehydrogenase/cyclohydrolase catalytic domain-containing protein [Bacteroidia bacterium]
MQLLDGKATATFFKEHIRTEALKLLEKNGKKPHLAAVLVGNDGASQTYVAHKIRACAEVSFHSSLIEFDDTIAESELLEKVDELNQNQDIDGFIVQLPLPKQIDVNKVIQAVDYRKDVDGFHPLNIGRMVKNLPCLLPATPLGIVMLLEHYKLETAGKHVLVIGRSMIVGTPISLMLSRDTYPGNATVTLAHRYSDQEHMKELSAEADIIITAVGIPGFLGPDMVKEGAVLIDVGTTRVPDATRKSGYRLRGDMQFEALKEKCSAMTPVPGGVGPMTITALLLNTLRAAKQEIFA